MEEYNKELLLLKGNNNFRTIKDIKSKNDKYIILNNTKMLNLSSNDYLNIGNNSALKKDFFENYYDKESFSSSSSRLLTGNETIYFELEEILSRLFCKEKALLFNSGYSANIGILSSLLNKNDVVFSDKLNHASIIDGIRLSEAKMFRYNHLNYEQLENFLINERKKYNKAIIISESLFSMDGDFADIAKLVELKNKYDCLLMIDESHSFGVYGKNGIGYCNEKDQVQNVDIIMSGLGKACGSIGAFCVANNDIINYLINKARSFIFSTSLPPINIAWTKYIVKDIFPKYNDKRTHLITLSKKFNEELQKIGFSNNSESFIIPIILNNEDDIKTLQDRLLRNGFYVLPIRYPTVPKNSPRFRISLTLNMNYDDIHPIINILNNLY